MVSESELRWLVIDISDRTARITMATRERLASCRDGRSLDAELKALSEDAVARSGAMLGRIRD